MLKDIVEKYLAQFPEERGGLKKLLEQVADGEKLNDRRNFRGHITGSAIILSQDKKQVLLIHHKAYDVWQQPGGHWESDDEANPLEVARRESGEELGLELKNYLPVDLAEPLIPLTIDSHDVPARPNKDEPAHVHHDFRYLFIIEKTSLQLKPDEITAARWVGLDDLLTERIRKDIAHLYQLKLV